MVLPPVNPAEPSSLINPPSLPSWDIESVRVIVRALVNNTILSITLSRVDSTSSLLFSCYLNVNIDLINLTGKAKISLYGYRSWRNWDAKKSRRIHFSLKLDLERVE